MHFRVYDWVDATVSRSGNEKNVIQCSKQSVINILTVMKDFIVSIEIEDCVWDRENEEKDDDYDEHLNNLGILCISLLHCPVIGMRQCVGFQGTCSEVVDDDDDNIRNEPGIYDRKPDGNKEPVRIDDAIIGIPTDATR